MRNTLDVQKKKIKSLKTTVTYLRRRIKSINGLLKHLKEKRYIEESSETMLKVRKNMNIIVGMLKNYVDWLGIRITSLTPNCIFRLLSPKQPKTCWIEF